MTMTGVEEAISVRVFCIYEEKGESVSMSEMMCFLFTGYAVSV